MSERFQRTLWVSVSPERVWHAFTDPSELAAWHGHAELFEARPGGRIRFVNPGFADVEGTVREAVPPRLLAWTVLLDRTEIREEFEAVGSGTQITVTHRGEGDEWLERLPAISLGWNESIADLVLYLEHGVAVSRHMTRRSELGGSTRDTPAGVEVVDVRQEGYASSVGLAPGDILVQLGTAPLFDRTDLALLLREHAPGTELEAVYVRERQLMRGTGKL